MNPNKSKSYIDPTSQQQQNHGNEKLKRRSKNARKNDSTENRVSEERVTKLAKKYPSDARLVKGKTNEEPRHKESREAKLRKKPSEDMKTAQLKSAIGKTVKSLPRKAIGEKTREKHTEFFVEDIANSDKDTECSGSASTKQGSAFGVVAIEPGALIEVMSRQVMFLCCGEPENPTPRAPLTKHGQLFSSRSGLELRASQLYFSTVILAPTVRCAQTTRFALKELIGGFDKTNICLEPGLLEAYEKDKIARKGLIAECKAHMADLVPNPSYTSCAAAISFTKEETKVDLEKRISMTIHNIMKSKLGNVLVICDPFVMDYGARSLLNLPPIADVDMAVITTKYAHSSLLIIDQIKSSSEWKLQRHFPTMEVDKKRNAIDFAFLRRKS